MRVLLCAALFLAMVSAPAFAQPKLVSSQPAANANLAKQARILLNFNEKITARATRVSLVMTAMPGMVSHPPMTMNGFTLQMAPDGKGVTLPLQRALPLGNYVVKRQVVDSSNETAQRSLTFFVK